ncbi:MAG: alkaline phosphatase family protein [Acidobacteriota bacterium]
MRYLRMLTNTAIGATLVALYLTIVVLQINPRFSIGGLPGLAVTLILSYGLHAAAAFYVLVVLRQLLSAEVISPGWISFRFLVWLSTLASAIGALLMWANRRSFAAVMDGDAVRRMTGGAIALTSCAFICAVLLVNYRLRRRRKSTVSTAALAVTVLASVAVPLTLRGPGTGQLMPATWPAPGPQPVAGGPTTRVTLVLLEGASLDVIIPAAASGRLPNFSRLLDDGASMHLASVRPTQPATVWTSACTGKLPYRNGIRSAASYWPAWSRDGLELLPDYCFAHALVRFGLLGQRVHTSLDRTARPIWAILSGQGVPVGLVNWSTTHPARPVHGYIVTDRFEAAEASPVELEGSDAVWPRDAIPLVSSVISSRPDPGEPLDPRLVTPCRADRLHERVSAELDRVWPARFRAVRYECIDAAGHYFLRYARPEAFGDVSDDEVLQHGSVLLNQYLAADDMVGREVTALRPGDLLLVVSGFGMEPLGVGKRLLERLFGNPELSGTHEGAPDGFLLAYGSLVKPGHYPRASVVDLTPTVLYYLGLPVGRDMDGYARADLFARDLTAARPITFIPSYEGR